MRKMILVFLLMSMCVVPNDAALAKFDGSAPLLCAPIEVIECEAAGKCFNGTPESVNIPQFFKINFQDKVLSATGKEGRKTPIKHVEHNQGKLIMQGGEAGRGLTMVISEETGKMSATMSEDRVGFIIFGACMAL